MIHVVLNEAEIGDFSVAFPSPTALHPGDISPEGAMTLGDTLRPVGMLTAMSLTY